MVSRKDRLLQEVRLNNMPSDDSLNVNWLCTQAIEKAQAAETESNQLKKARLEEVSLLCIDHLESSLV